MHPTSLRGDTGDYKFPVVLQAHTQEPPVNQRQVVRDEQHRTGSLQNRLVVRPEPEKPSRQPAQHSLHNLENLPRIVFTESQKRIPPVTRTENGASQWSRGKRPFLANSSVPAMIAASPGNGAEPTTRPERSIHCEIPELQTRKMGTPHSAARTGPTLA